jgi:ATP synthase subunit 6
MAANPMTQFEVYRIGPEIKIGAFDISFTNASLFMVISSFAILIIFNLGSKKNSILPNKLQLLAELSYSFVSKMISDTAGSKAKPYFSFIFSLFMFVLFCNMFGMIPYTFTVTSHIIVTFVLAAFIFIGVTIIGFIKHGFGYLKLFVPSGVPIVLLPLIVVIEIISITTINGNKTIGTPLGTKSFKYPSPCLINPIIVTPININAANTKVTMMWLVTVKEYGIIPNMLQNKTNMNKENMKEK